MKERKSRLFTYIGLALVLVTLVLLAVVNSGLARLAEWIYAGAGLWAHLGLALIELAAILWLWRGVFGRHQHLLTLDHPDAAEQEEFAAELARRMRANSLIAAYAADHPGALDPAASDYLDSCLAVLGRQADSEIRQNSKRIFLATALSQNGRLDALIVFVSLCRLVWRVSKIYNQRPHPREILSLYGAVVSSTFLALSLEELDIGTEITVGFGEAFNATAPASLTASIPFAGKALQTFTASTIDGAANCYLALRAGIITRNAYAYGPKPGGWPSRAAVYKEAGGMLMGMSQELVGKLASALAGKLGGLARQAQSKSAKLGRDIAQGVGSGAGKLASGVGNGAVKLADGAVYVAKRTGKAAKAGASAGTKAALWPLKQAAKPFRKKKTDK